MQTAYEQIVGSTYATAAGINPAAAIADITSRQGYFQQVAAERMAGQNQDLAVKAAVVGYIMAEAIKADVGLYAAGVNNFLFDLAPDGLAQYNNDLAVNYGLQTGGLSPAGHIIALTANFDAPGSSAPSVNTQGGGGADLYIADNTTLTTDSINGGLGADTLVITNANTNPATSYTTTPSLVSVEQVVINSNAGSGTTLNLVNSTDVTSVVVRGALLNAGPNDSAQTGTVSVLNASSGLTVTMDVDDQVQSGALTYSLKTDGLNDSLNVNLRSTDTAGTVSSQGLSTLTAEGVETLTINTSRAVIANTTIDAGDTLTIGTINDAALTKLVLTGDSAVTLTGFAPATGALATIDASTMTKNVTLGGIAAFGTAAAGADVTTGTGDDIVYLNVGTASALKTINLGGGSDTLILTGGAAIGGQTIINLNAADQVSQVVGIANASIQSGIENVDLRGLTGTAVVTGGAGVNSITGTANNDTITGDNGGDNINVGAGIDTLVMSATGQTATGPTANATLTGADVITNFGAGDRIDLGGIGAASLGNVAATAEGTLYLTGSVGAQVALIQGTYVASTGAFTAAAGGLDLMFEYDTNGSAVAGGLEAIILVGSNASISTVSSNSAGLFTFG